MATINNITHDLQVILKSIMSSMDTLQFDAKRAYDAYWDTDTTTLVSAAGASEQVLVSPQVSKTTYTNGTTLAENLYKFFNNLAVGAVDHLEYCNELVYGEKFETPITAELSPATASIGEQLVAISETCLKLLDQSRIAMNIYNDNELSGVLSAISPERIVFGSSMSKTDLSNAITLCQQFESFMIAVDPTDGDYSTTLSKWRVY